MQKSTKLRYIAVINEVLKLDLDMEGKTGSGGKIYKMDERIEISY